MADEDEARGPRTGCGPTRRCRASWRRSCRRPRTSSRRASSSARTMLVDAGRPGPRPARRALRQYADAGVDELFVQQIGPEQDAFFDRGRPRSCPSSRARRCDELVVPRGRAPTVSPEVRWDATPFLPERKSLKALREAAARCRGCPLYAPATQAVFSTGPKRARIMMVGEMPGDREDLAGQGVRRAGRPELDKALQAVGHRARRHLHHERRQALQVRGARQAPHPPEARQAEVDACLPWLRAELDVVNPSALLLLGATAARALLGAGFRVTRVARPADRLRARRLRGGHDPPSAILRARDAASREAQREAFTADLSVMAEHLQ